MHHIRTTAIAVLAAIAGMAALSGAASATTITVDNFEEYAANQDIATAYNSSPWERFGKVEDDFYAKPGAAMDGALGAQIPVDPTGFNGASILKNLGGATDLSGYGSASVLSESLDAPNGVSSAQISLSITDGNTTYQSDTPDLLTTTATSYNFLIDGADLMDVDDEAGPETLATVLANATAIGFRITSPQGVTALETVAFDDFTLSTPAAVPEPATASLLLVGAVATGMRRRRTV